MAQYVLEILSGDRAGTVVPLGENTVRIGRKPENELVLADEKVSGRHAEVVFEEGRYVLRDLGSTNGTSMDGRPVEEVVLTAQDTFQVGRILLSFHEAGQEAGGDLRLRRVSAEDLSRSGRSTRWLGGLGGALVSWVVIALTLWWLRQPLSALASLYQSNFSLQGLGVRGGLQLLMLGAVLGLLGAWLAVARHLRAIQPT